MRRFALSSSGIPAGTSAESRLLTVFVRLTLPDTTMRLATAVFCFEWGLRREETPLTGGASRVHSGPICPLSSAVARNVRRPFATVYIIRRLSMHCQLKAWQMGFAQPALYCSAGLLFEGLVGFKRAKSSWVLLWLPLVDKTPLCFSKLLRRLFFHPSYSVCVPTVEMAHFMRYNWS